MEQGGTRERLVEAAGVAMAVVLFVVAVVVCHRLGWTGRRSVRVVLASLLLVPVGVIMVCEDVLSGRRNRRLGPARHKRRAAGEE
jgi:hypothetical protein